MSPTTMYDSVNGYKIPQQSGIVVAGYIDGDYAWTSDMWARFSENVKLTITVKGDLRANAADVERGDMTPQDARNWIIGKQRNNDGPCIVYCSRGAHSGLVAACGGLAYYWWCADWTNQPHQVPGAELVQYESDTAKDYDLSCIWDDELVSILNAANRPWIW